MTKEDIIRCLFQVGMKFPKHNLTPINQVYDENMSVEWNREQVEIKNQEYWAEYDRYYRECQMSEEQVKSEIIDVISRDYGFTKEQAEVIVASSWYNLKAPGICSVETMAKEMAQNFANIISCFNSLSSL